MFNVQDGLVHFIFANEDLYVLESMISLNLTEYLHYILKNKEFDTVCFIRGIKPPYTLQFLDRHSHESYHKAVQSPIDKWLHKEFPRYDGNPLLCSEDQLLRLMRKGERTAFVYRIESFFSFFKNRDRELEDLILDNEFSNNLIVVLSNTNAEDSLPYLMERQGIFQRQGYESALFPEVVSAFNGYSSLEESCYLKFKTLCGDKCTFLNCFSRTAIADVIRWVYMMRLGKEDDLSDGRLNMIMRFVESWYHSIDLQCRYKDCFSENEQRSFSLLAEDLVHRWLTIEKCAADLAQSPGYKGHQKELYVTAESPLKKRLGAVRFYEREEAVDGQMFRRWLKLMEEFRKPRCVPIDRKLEDILFYVIGQMDIAIEHGDDETYQRICTTLEYAVRTGFDYNDINRNIWEWYMKIIDISASIFELDQQINGHRNDLIKWKGELEEKREQIYNMNDGAVEAVVAHEKAKAINLSKKIRSREQMLIKDAKTFNVFQNMLNQWEMVIGQKKEMDIGELKQALLQCTKEMNQYHSRTSSELYSIDSSAHQLNELIGMSAELSVDDEYEQLMNEYDYFTEKGSDLPTDLSGLLEEDLLQINL